MISMRGLTRLAAMQIYIFSAAPDRHNQHPCLLDPGGLQNLVTRGVAEYRLNTLASQQFDLFNPNQFDSSLRRPP